MIAVKHSQPSKLLKFALGAIAGLVGLGVIALIPANLSAERQEIAIEKEVTEFLKKFPYRPSNASAIKLQTLAARLGIKIDAPTSNGSSIAKTEQQAFAAIEKTLTRYLETQSAKTSDRLGAPPLELVNYLKTRAQTLTALRNHLRYYKTPDWGTNLHWIESGDVTRPLPSFLGLVRLQKLLLLDAIEQHDRGNQRQVLENLEASWQLTKSVQNRPELISQFASIMLTRNQLGVLRHLDNLPSHWIKRLSEHHYHQSVVTALKSESFFYYAFTQHLSSSRLTQIDRELGTDYEEEYPGLKWSGIAGKIYLRHTGISRYQAVKDLRDRLTEVNACESNSADLPPTKNWGNIEEISGFYSVPEVIQKASQIELETELTQRILQAKTIAAKEGKSPRSLPNLASSVCPGFQWVYQPSTDGKASITLNPTPNFTRSGLPLSYTLKL
jgi:hypothetical protein